MIELVRARIRRVLESRAGRVELELELEDEVRGCPGPVRALGLKATGDFPWQAGQWAWVNATARCLGLGTGGVDFAVAPCDGTANPPSVRGRLDRRHGHIVKLRYTPLQHVVLACEEPRGPYHRALRGRPHLRSLPVGVLSLHSMLGPVSAAFKLASGCAGEGGNGEARLAYVMTDSAALPAGISRLLDLLRRRRLVDLVVTAGQAFGGDLEAVHPASAMAACGLAGASAVLVGPGPGVVGTGTALGTSCLEVAALADLAGALGARVVVVPRLSFADRRRRHRPVSHHTLTALGHLTHERCLVVLPRTLSGRHRAGVLARLAEGGVLHRHHVIQAVPPPAELVRARLGSEWRSMGRSDGDDPAFWDACTAAGRVLALMATGKA